MGTQLFLLNALRWGRGNGDAADAAISSQAFTKNELTE